MGARRYRSDLSQKSSGLLSGNSSAGYFAEARVI
jgi:hypothetical protein